MTGSQQSGRLASSNVCFRESSRSEYACWDRIQGQELVYSVEKLRFEKSGDFICDLSSIA